MAQQNDTAKTRYLLFQSDYDGDDFIREVFAPLTDLAQDGDKILAVEDGKAPYWLELEYADTAITGQGRRRQWNWIGSSDALIWKDHEEIEYRYGEPVPEGYTKRFDGTSNRIMSLDEATQIEQLERDARNAVKSGENYSIHYPNGATVTRQRSDIIATGVMGTLNGGAW